MGIVRSHLRQLFACVCKQRMSCVHTMMAALGLELFESANTAYCAIEACDAQAHPLQLIRTSLRGGFAPEKADADRRQRPAAVRPSPLRQDESFLWRKTLHDLSFFFFLSVLGSRTQVSGCGACFSTGDPLCLETRTVAQVQAAAAQALLSLWRNDGKTVSLPHAFLFARLPATSVGTTQNRVPNVPTQSAP